MMYLQKLLDLRYARLFSPQNKSYNISSSDVIGLLAKSESMYQKPSDANFLFFVKSLYLIRLYEAYDSVTESQLEDIEEENFGIQTSSA